MIMPTKSEEGLQDEVPSARYRPMLQPAAHKESLLRRKHFPGDDEAIAQDVNAIESEFL